MPRQIRIAVGGISLTAELEDSVTAQRVWDALPFRSAVNRWGEEIYFSVPVDVDLEAGARQDVRVGELGFWPPGGAFCVFFGPTPVSIGEQPRAYSAVNVFGRVIGDATVLTAVRDGAIVNVCRGEASSGPER